MDYPEKERQDYTRISDLIRRKEAEEQDLHLEIEALKNFQKLCRRRLRHPSKRYGELPKKNKG